jgi:hypothetical protein
MKVILIMDIKDQINLSKEINLHMNYLLELVIITLKLNNGKYGK